MGDNYRVDINDVDNQIEFLAKESQELMRKYPGAPWASAKAMQFNAIKETLVTVRRAQQMTGMNGQRIE